MKTTKRIEFLIRAGFIGIALYLMTSSTVMYLQFGRLHEAQKWVEHTHQIRFELKHLLGSITAAEAGQRSYLLTNSPNSLDLYTSSISIIPSIFAGIQTLMDNPEQQQRVAELEGLVDQRLGALAKVIGHVERGDHDAAIELVRSGGGTALMARIRAVIGEMEREEDKLFSLRAADMENARRTTILMFGILLLLFGGLAGAFFVMSNRMAKQREQILDQLMDANTRTARADKFKGDLLNYLGQALHAPLSAMANDTDLLLYRADNALPEKDGKIVQSLRAKIRSLLSLATNFLHIGRLQAGKQLALDEDDIDLMDIVRETVDLVSPAAEKSRITVRTSAPFGRALVRCDKHKLRQILLNLLDNAIRHTPPHGSIDIAVNHRPEDGVILTIRDSGRGIAPEQLKRVLIPFAEIGGMLARQEDGIGLGLPMALGFAEAHGGTLKLQSAPSEGTTAVVTLPASRVIRIFAAT